MRGRSPLMWLLAACASLMLAGCGSGDGALELSPPEHDFGRVLWFTDHTANFTLTNHSSRTVAIRAEVKCACFGLGSGVRPALAPGESTSISVRYTTGAVPPGPLRGKFLVITTDHPDFHEILAPLTGESFLAYEVTPSEIELGRLDGRPENYQPRRVLVRPLAGHSVVIERVMAQPQDAFDIKQGETDGVLWLDITLRRDAFRPTGSKFIANVKLDLLIDGAKDQSGRQSALVNLRARWALPASATEERIK